MATITSTGIGSGLDIEGLIAKLINAEKAPTTARLDLSQARTQAELSALGSFKSALASLQTALDGLKSGGGIAALKAATSDSSILTASADATAVRGSYGVEVIALAQAQKLQSAAYASSSAAVGTGTLTIAVGSASFSVNIASGANSLSAIRDAINSAADNKGVTASIISGADGAHLVLTSTSTGIANALTVTTSGGDGGLAGLVYDPANANTRLTQIQAAANAQIKIDGVSYTGGSNTVADAIQGVTLNLAKAAPGTTVTVAIDRDTKAATDAVNGFVQAYNSAVGTIASLTRYDASTKTAGALLGDPAVTSLANRMRQIVGNTVSGVAGLSMLADLGITTNVDGTLKLDAAKLSGALGRNAATVSDLFGSGGGFATQLAAAVAPYLAADGIIQSETDGAQRNLDDIQKSRDALTRRLTQLETMYRAQFTALDALVGQLRATSDYLTQQLAALRTSSSAGGR